MNILATMTPAEYQHVIAELDARGLGYRKNRSRNDEQRANWHAVEILQTYRRTH